ncbi:MAG: TraR/DksA C4-type zinc finger protein [Candidatus Doudnabacteria bacterium]|nr:TraR/DksA C4-type zinc finger protein [Candidatus Doudnabacteria bacterium]
MTQQEQSIHTFPLPLTLGRATIKGFTSKGEVEFTEGKNKAIRELKANARNALEQAVLAAFRTNRKFRESWRAWLEAELGFLEENLNRANQSHRDNHERRSFINTADIRYDANEHARTTTILRTYPPRIRMLREAIDRVNHGAYGICRKCKKPIGIARLQAAPGATHCVACAETH